ncbi:uncharacterized protein LOC133181413 [Saccostrea echinata]|uniref:uncharacterized protein LOC133181413 n=1 Tax=Saccostrea echinata TaxID=191078 RepID=UPI002A81E6AF|nr:uncharacterized protein LOC133181413 [Saccostrea echinata]
MMSKKKIIVLFSYILVVVAELCQAQTKLLTYNAGLLGSIPYKQERGDYIAANIGHTDPDIICLQEVWLRRDVELLTSTNQYKYPYFFSAVNTETSSKPPCANISLISVFFKLLANGCTKRATSAEKAQCATEKTGVLNLPQKCISCLAISSTNDFSFSNLLRDCVVTTQGEVNLPGLLVLSKRPMLYPVVKYFLPSAKKTAYRGYIHFQDVKVGDIVCTHLTPLLGPIYVEPNLQGIFEGYADQNFFETVTLDIYLSSSSRAVIMGDLNCGPGLPEKNIVEECEKSYYQFKLAGYKSPYVERVGLCTYCSDNALGLTQYDMTNQSIQSNIIDHIFVRGVSVVFIQRVLTEYVPGLPYTPSDHYGVQATVVDKGKDLKYLLVPWPEWIT